MSRLAVAFARARAEGRAALVIYLTAGDPDRETSARLLSAAVTAGADVLELGVPWSDPSADGPAIQRAMKRAREGGGGLRSTLALCRDLRARHPDIPVVLFGYANPIFVRGAAAFAEDARAAGADGVLCVDWPPDEADELTLSLRSHNIDFIPLLAPTSTPERIRRIAPTASGFIYYVSLTGITGAALTDLSGPERHVGEIRAAAGGGIPIAVGFGVERPDQARAIARFADGVVVGSAAVRAVEDAVAQGRDPAAALAELVRGLRAALGRG